MDKERVRKSFNLFLKMYFQSCREVYEELDLEGISDRQFKYLRKIDNQGSVTMTELAEMFNLSKPTVTEVVRRFEEGGLIEKKRCTHDARVFNITLTKRGKLLAKTNILESDRALEKIFATLDADELETLIKLFDKIGKVTT